MSACGAAACIAEVNPAGKFPSAWVVAGHILMVSRVTIVRTGVSAVGERATTGP